MKESIGGTQLFGIVITLILVFSGIMALTINHANAFSVKDQIVTVIEKYGGLDIFTDYTTNNTIQEIVELLQETSYRQQGKCPEALDGEQIQGYNRSGDMDNNNASFCIVKIKAHSSSGTPQAYYYKVIVFYRLDLPILKSFLNFRVIGETKVLYS